jgi:putative transposase
MPDDPQRLLIDFMPMETRTIQRYGVQWDKVTYYDPVLDTYINTCDPKSGETKEKFVVRRDPRDVSCIYFYDPEERSYTRLPYRNIGHPAISLYELKEARRRLSEEGIRDVDEVLIFEQVERQRQRVAKAVEKSKSARRAQARSHPSAKPVTAPAAPLPQVAGTTRASPSVSALSSSPDTVEEDIFAQPIRPFDEIAIRR